MQISITTQGRTLIRHTIEPRPNEIIVADRTNSKHPTRIASMHIVRIAKTHLTKA